MHMPTSEYCARLDVATLPRGVVTYLQTCLNENPLYEGIPLYDSLRADLAKPPVNGTITLGCSFSRTANF